MLIQKQYNIPKIELSKTQLHIIGQSGWFLVGALLKTGLYLMKNVRKPLAKYNLIPLGLTAAAPDASIDNKMYGSGMTTRIILNEEMNFIRKIVTSNEESGVLIKGYSKTIKNEAKQQKGGLFSMILGTLGASLLRNMLKCNGKISASEGTIRNT